MADMTMPLRQHFATIAAAMRDGSPLDADDAARIADAFDQIARGVAPDIAFDLRLKPGQHRLQEQIAARDALLREAARMFWPNASAAGQARQLSRSLKNYRSDRWERDRIAVECPHRSGTLAAYLWQALRLRDRAIGVRQMERIITTSAPRF